MIKVLIRTKPDRPHLQLYYVNPLTGSELSKSAKTADRDEAARAAARWEDELRSNHAPSRTSWATFRQRFEAEHLPQLSKHTRIGYGTAFNHFERIIGKPTMVSAINASVVSQFKGALSKEGMEDSSIGTHLTHLRSALRWAASIGIIPVAPTIKIPKAGKRKLNRGRSLTQAEVDLMIKVTPEVVGDEYAAEWVRMLRGLRLCGLRLDEALRLSWDTGAARVDLDSGRFPRILWFSEGHKARRDDVVPMTPDFAEFLRLTPKDQRKGRVFAPQLPTRTVTTHYAGRVISAIGVKAKIVVNEKGKHASAHDLRRTFGTYWAMKVRPVTLKALMRHASIETTLKYYVDLSCDDVGSELWGVAVIEKCPDVCPESAS